MPSARDDILERLRAHQIPGLDLGEGFLYPHYQGYSILNIPSTICKWLGLPGLGAAPLAEEIVPKLDRSFPRVVLVLLDALGYQRFVRWLEQYPALAVWQSLTERGGLMPITSISPSTTSSALTSLWSGRSPSEHAITGYEMWMKEYGIVVNTIQHKPISYQGGAGGLERAGFKPESFLGFPTLGEHLLLHGVKSYALQHHSIAASGLSRMLMKEVRIQMFHSAADLWVNLRQLLEGSRNERFFAWVYWSEVDTFGHFYSPDDERVAAEFVLFSQAMQQFFLERLSRGLRQDTLFILTADHGQLVTQPNAYYELRNHPTLTRRLHILPTGENRLAYFYIRPGQTEAVREYLDRAWPNQFAVVESAYAAESGLFGPGRRHPSLLDRLGDYLVVARNDAYLWWANKENELHGRHGGLHPEEMLVPFLTAVL
jgi:hypothetical protein